MTTIDNLKAGNNSPPKRLTFNIFAIIILCFLGVIIYSNAFHVPFQFDDKFLIRNLNVISSPSGIGVIWKYWASRFITFLTFAINYKINGLDVFGYHLVNLIIHLGSSIGVFWLTRLILSTPNTKDDPIAKHYLPISLFTALIFLSHPIQTESVTYIYQRTTSLTGFFYLFSLCLYIKSRLLKEEKKPTSDWRRPYILTWFFALAAMFTKENAVTLPLMIILCEFCFFAKGRHMRRRYAFPFLVLLPIIPILLLFTKPITFVDLQGLGEQPIKGGHYLLTQLHVMVTYLRLLFVPLNQNLDYDYPIVKNLTEPAAFISFLFLSVILITAIKLFRRYRLISFGVFWFFLCLAPESSFIPLNDVIFEHRLYLPMFGYSLFLVSAAYYLFGRKSFKLMVSALIAIIACYSVLTYNRNLTWRDEFTLWNDVIRKSPNKARSYIGRGFAYFNKGNLDQAISDYNKAVTIYPEYAEAYNNRGVVYFNKGNLDQAISDYDKAITINPEYAEAHNNRGLVYFNKGNLDQAISDYDKAVTIYPEYAEAYNNRGVVYFNKGDLDQAISDYDKAIMFNPQYGIAYYNRGLAYFYKKDYDKTWENVHKAEGLGYKVNPQFIVELKKASGREK